MEILGRTGVRFKLKEVLYTQPSPAFPMTPIALVSQGGECREGLTILVTRGQRSAGSTKAT